MKTDPVEPADLLNLLRQQLILAQVRIMELDDLRDELADKLTDTEALLTAAQKLADSKSEEAGHLANTLSGLQAQYEHLRHMQHVTNEALNETRRQLAEITAQLADVRLQGEQQRKEIAGLSEQAGQLNASLQQVNRALAEETATAAARLLRINTLDSELRTMRASRSWRWTRWLRALERHFPGGKP